MHYSLEELISFIKKSGQDGAESKYENWSAYQWRNRLKNHFSADWAGIVKAQKNWPTLDKVRPQGDYTVFCTVLLNEVGLELAQHWYHSTILEQRLSAERWLINSGKLEYIPINIDQLSEDADWLDKNMKKFWHLIPEDTKSKFLLPKSILQHIENTSLFYPCSGRDLLMPINLFAPYVTDFWFVDRGYFTPDHCDTCFYGYDAPADQQEPVLLNNKAFRFIDKNIVGPPTWN